MLKTVFLSLGSNLGDRAHNLEEAVRQLESADLVVVRKSSLYETEPRDFLEQPWFLNMVVEAETRLLPRQLLSRVKKVERVLGRRRVINKGPRTIDIDILIYGRSAITAHDLEIPHPRMMDRRFVLEPLSEVAPELRHPRTGARIRDHLNALIDQKVTKVKGP